MKKIKCKECGDYYSPERKKICIELNHKDIEAIEEMFFVDLTEEETKKILPRIIRVWKQICEEEEKKLI